MCGVAGVYGVERPLGALIGMMDALQYRGGQGSGVALIQNDGLHFYRRVADELSELARGDDFCDSQDRSYIAGIGHLRYGTAGTRRLLANTQPFYGKTFFGDVYVGHNGDTPFFASERSQLLAKGAAMVSDCDSELFLHYIGEATGRGTLEAVKKGLEQYPGTYALTILVQDREGVRLILARDPSGNRPLSLGKLGRGFISASEDSAFEAVGGTKVREINPGEMLVIADSGETSYALCPVRPLKKKMAKCVFENIYFSFPNSEVFDMPVAGFRESLGEVAASHSGHLVSKGDIIANVPDSSNAFADGFCRRLVLPLERIFIRRHMTRSFTKESDERRDETVRRKFSINHRRVKGKRIWLLDDSIVRGVTSRRLIRVLRNAGASWVGVVISCPPIVGPCGKGMDFSADGLIARKHLVGKDRVNIEAIKEYIGADALYYNRDEDVRAVIRELGGNPDHFCFGCFENIEPIWGAW